MQGLDFKGVKKHPSLIPLYLVLSFGCSAAIICTIRTSLKNPDITWSHKGNPEPWNEYSDKDYNKFINAKKSIITDRNQRFSIWELITERFRK